MSRDRKYYMVLMVFEVAKLVRFDESAFKLFPDVLSNPAVFSARLLSL